MTELARPVPDRIILSAPDNPVELRQLIPVDAPAYFALIDFDRDHLSQFGDDTAAKYQTEMDVLESILHPSDPGKYRFGIWVNDTMVGSDNIRPQANGTAELGSWVGSQFIGHNYAAYGRELLIDFAFRELGVREVFSMIKLGNIASRKSVEKSGLRLRSEANGVWVLALQKAGYRG